jgi:hypothetical protein
MKMIAEHWWNDTDRGKTEVLGEKPVTVPLCPPYSSRGLACDRTRPCTKCLHYTHKFTFTLQIFLLQVSLISDRLRVLKSAFPGRCNLDVRLKRGHSFSEGASASGEPVLVLQFDTGRCLCRARAQAAHWPAADHVLTHTFCLPEQCENRHVLRSQNGFLRYRLQTRRWTVAFLRPASVRCRLFAASGAALLRRDTTLAQCQHSSSSAQVTVVSICTAVFSVPTRLQAEQ